MPSRRSRASPPARRRKTKSRVSPRTSDRESASARSTPSRSQKTGGVRIAGIGASAGGLEAISRVLGGLPADLGLALVIVPHLSPKHASALPELLASATQLKLEQVTDGTAIEADHVYVIPPDTTMEVIDGVLRLRPRDEAVRPMPIDVFFHSLARCADGKGIGVVLSGTASDGALGLRDIKAAGGIAIAQDPETAAYDGMPRAAIATGVVDFTGAPEQIAAELVRIAKHPYLKHQILRTRGDELAIGDDQLGPVYAMLRRRVGVDFSAYKTPTLKRRIQRRMALQRVGRFEDYLRLLEGNPAEVQALYRDILIHVTGFFREPQAYALLYSKVFPDLVRHNEEGRSVRVWVPGCSTGEEAYSLAMAFLEFCEARSQDVPLQIFATDLSEEAVEHGRVGRYPESIAGDVSEERLRRFFVKVDGGYRVKQVVRERCVFARQDLTRDPPFSRLDLIVCRNVLIYLGADAQGRLLSTFHYALRPHGYLLLGDAESIGSHTTYFAAADKKRKLYTKKAVDSPVHLDVRLTTPRATTGAAVGSGDGRTVVREVGRLILDHYAPTYVLLDEAFHVVEARGSTAAYLELPPGRASLDVLKMARDGVAYGLRAALQKARRTGSRTRREGLRVKRNGATRPVAVEVVPLPVGSPTHFLVIFDDRIRQEALAEGADADESGAVKKRPRGKKASRRSTHDAHALEEVENELRDTREQMRTVVQDLEAANEELQSANEEILSANEELQSTNEELDTAREELQSTNEEINTVNEELQHRNEELMRVNSDLVNLLGSVPMAVVIVSADLRIRRFTPMAERVLNLRESDFERPIGHINPRVEFPDIEQRMRSAVEDIEPFDGEVKDGQGRWYSVSIRPYKNLDNQIDGAVMSLFEITASKQHAGEIMAARDFAEAVVDAVREPLLVLDRRLDVVAANHAFCAAFDLDRARVVGRPLSEMPGWRHAEVQSRLRDVSRGVPLSDLVVERETGTGERRKVVLDARAVETAGRPPVILLTVSSAGECRDPS